MSKTIGLTSYLKQNSRTTTQLMRPQGSAPSKRLLESTHANQKHPPIGGLKERYPTQKNERTICEQRAKRSRPSYETPKKHKRSTTTQSTPQKRSDPETRCFSAQRI